GDLLLPHSECPLLAQSGHANHSQRCPLSGVKRTSRGPRVPSWCVGREGFSLSANHHPTETASFYFHLREPEPHVQLAVNIGRGGKMLTGAFRLTHTAVEPTHAGMTVGDEWSHPARFGECQRLLVVGDGAFGIEMRLF